MNERSFVRAARTVTPVDMAAAQTAVVLHSQLTKPAGSLGRLEGLGPVGRHRGPRPPPVPEPVTVAVFAGDHGVVAAGVTAWPQEVTAQMVANFCAGGAAINVLARMTGAGSSWSTSASPPTSPSRGWSRPAWLLRRTRAPGYRQPRRWSRP